MKYFLRLGSVIIRQTMTGLKSHTPTQCGVGDKAPNQKTSSCVSRFKLRCPVSSSVRNETAVRPLQLHFRAGTEFKCGHVRETA